MLMSNKYKWPIYGHKRQLKFLQKILNQEKLANAYLFYGPSGLGKKLSVDYFIKSIFCESTSKPCKKCNNCKMINRNTFLNLDTLGKNEDLSIENVRYFLNKILLSRVNNKRKVAVIYNIDRINLHGANSLLKTLEEPPKDTTIILIANSIINLPVTILSRSQSIKFQSLTRNDMKEWLENFKLNKKEKNTIINLSFGRPGLALSYIEDNLEVFKKDSEFIMNLLNSNTFDYLQNIDKWFNTLKKENPSYKIQELGNLTKKYLDLFELFLRDLLWIKLDREIANDLYNKKLIDLSNKFSKKILLKNLLNLNNLKKKLKYNVSPQLLWENLLLSIK